MLCWRSRLMTVATAFFAVVTASVTHAQTNYPAEIVKIVVPYPPGAGIDFLGRTVAERLSTKWNQKVIVENRAVAAGLAGSETVARSAPDGYTLLVMPLDVAINPNTISRDSNDPVRNLRPIASLSASTQIIAASKQSGIKSISDLIKRAKAEPGKITFASCGAGSPGQIIGELIKEKAKIDILHVAYKGCAPAVNDALGGHVALVIGGAGTVAAPVNGGLLTGIAVASDERDPELPNLPTLVQEGLDGIVLVNWFSLFGPPKLPNEIVTKISADLREIYKDKEFTDGILKRTMRVNFHDRATFEPTMKRDVEHFGRLLQKLNSKS